MEKKVVHTEKAPAAIGPYSQAVSVGDMVFTSGQIPINPETGVFPEGIEAQTAQALSNVEQVLLAAGTDLRHVVKTTVFLSNMDDFAAMNSVYQDKFGEAPYPARSAVEVARLPKDALIEIEAVAIL